MAGADEPGEKRRGVVFVHHRLDAPEGAPGTLDYRDAAAARGDHDHPGRGEPAYRLSLHEGDRARRGDHPPVALPRHLHHPPALLGFEPFCLHRRVNRPDRFLRNLERRVGSRDQGPGEHRRDRAVDPRRKKRFLHRLREHVADHPLTFRPTDIKRHRREDILCQFVSEENIPHLGPVPVRDDDGVAVACYLCDMPRSAADICELLFGRPCLPVTQDGVPAERNYHGLSRHPTTPAPACRSCSGGRRNPPSGSQGGVDGPRYRAGRTPPCAGRTVRCS
ncbi:hypothetical protein DSECCO2_465780 [anaerobic digester metagenome]